MSRPSVFLRICIVLSFFGSLYCFGDVVRHWAASPRPCVDTAGFVPCGEREEVACRNPEQTLTWQPAHPTGFTYQCTCFRPAKK